MVMKMSINGIVNINKPRGKTSFSVISHIKRLSGEKHVGHTGTLDPLATGVLPVCIGQATRVVQYLINSDKTYLAEIELGITTDTFDGEGEITSRLDFSSITAVQIERALVIFKGVIEQSPPIYSAIKYKGKKLYELARAGKTVQPKPREVRINSIDLVDCNLPLFTIKVECGKGTYIRSLAHDVGQYLGCGAFLKNLVRTRCGPFNIEESHSPSEIEEYFKLGIINNILHPIDIPLLNWPAAVLNSETELAVRNGRLIALAEEKLRSDEYCRAYSLKGDFVAVLRFIPDKNLWHPEKVFSLQYPLPTVCPACNHCCSKANS
ncbi:tRNA pseudouridine(55) synthase TruB [Chloroflexota bacterium]